MVHGKGKYKKEPGRRARGGGRGATSRRTFSYASSNSQPVQVQCNSLEMNPSVCHEFEIPNISARNGTILKK